MKKLGVLLPFDLSNDAPMSYDQAMRCGALMGRHGMERVLSGEVILDKESYQFTLAFPDGMGQIYCLKWSSWEQWIDVPYDGENPQESFRMVKEIDI